MDRIDIFIPIGIIFIKLGKCIGISVPYRSHTRYFCLTSAIDFPVKIQRNLICVIMCRASIQPGFCAAESRFSCQRIGEEITILSRYIFVPFLFWKRIHLLDGITPRYAVIIIFFNIFKFIIVPGPDRHLIGINRNIVSCITGSVRCMFPIQSNGCILSIVMIQSTVYPGFCALKRDIFLSKRVFDVIRICQLIYQRIRDIL